LSNSAKDCGSSEEENKQPIFTAKYKFPSWFQVYIYYIEILIMSFFEVTFDKSPIGESTSRGLGI